MENKPVTAIIVGAGHRSMVYSKLALTNPELLKIVVLPYDLGAQNGLQAVFDGYVPGCGDFVNCFFALFSCNQ